MAEKQPSKTEIKRERQPISIPFIWEEKPGTPKRDWKPSPTRLIIPDAPPPAKLVVSVRHVTFTSPPKFSESEHENSKPIKPVPSVPFRWEEKPGTPIITTFPIKPPSNQITFTPPPSFSEIDNTDIYSEDSFHSGELMNSPGYESDCSISSYATGNGSFAGTSFLEWLFPLLVPRDHHNKEDHAEFTYERSVSQVRSKVPLLTLGEMIVMSRRRSCQRKVMNIRKQTSMDFMKGNSFGCGMFGSGNGFIGLQKKWKRHLQLKLIQLFARFFKSAQSFLLFKDVMVIELLMESLI